MIFRRKKKTDEQETAPTAAPAEVELGAEADAPDLEETDLETGADAPGQLPEPAAPGADLEAVDPDFDADALDARDWRGDGPYDVGEVDLDEAPGESEPRIDLGSMVLTGFAGAELRLQVAEETGQIISAMLISDSSALELGAYAAPRSGGYWAELRDEILESAIESGGSAVLVEGPFGVELRRLLPVTTPEGEEGYQPSRMWVVEGPRWLLRGIVYGQAALEEGVEPPVAELLTAFRRVVVRRTDEAMAPGDLLTMRMPENLIPDEPEQTAD